MARASVWAWATTPVLAVALATAPVPDDVAAWFAEDAAATVSSVGAGTDPGSGRGDVTVGSPHELHQWSREFRAGTQTGTPVTPLEQWVASYLVDGRPAGSVTAWREDGTVTFASADDHVALGAALADLPPGAPLVHEPMLAAYFTLADGEVTTLVAGFYDGAPSAPVDVFQDSLAEQLDGLLGATVTEETGPRWWVPVTWGALAVAVLGGLGLAVVRQRHAAGRPPADVTGPA